jgi:hypothetical protein
VAEPHEDPETGREKPATAEAAPGPGGRKKAKKDRKGRGGPEAAPKGGAFSPEAEPLRPPEPVAPKHRVLPPAGGGKPEGDLLLETASKSIETLRRNWHVIAAALLVVLVASVFFALRIEAAKRRQRDAWEALRQVERVEGAPVEDYLRGAENFRGTTAEPFFLLRAADTHFARGGKEALAEAAKLYRRVAEDFGENPLAAQLAKNGLEAIRAALDFDPAKALAEKGPPIERAKDLPPLPGPSSGPAAPEPPK